MTASCHFTYYILRTSAESNKPSPSLLSGHILCGWCTFLSWSLLGEGGWGGGCTVIGVWDHFRLLDVPLCYCASEIMWPCIFHTHCFHIDASIYLHRSLQRGKVHFWNTCICRKKIQPDFFFFFFNDSEITCCSFNCTEMVLIFCFQCLEQYSSTIFLDSLLNYHSSKKNWELLFNTTAELSSDMAVTSDSGFSSSARPPP